MQLVYVEGQNGRPPIPEKWPEPVLDMRGRVRPYLVAHKLTQEQANLTLAQLEKIFPPPACNVG